MSTGVIINTTTETINLQVSAFTDTYSLSVINVEGPTRWGMVVGTLSAQTDLYIALSALQAFSYSKFLILSAGLDVTNTFLAANSGYWNTAYQSVSTTNALNLSSLFWNNAYSNLVSNSAAYLSAVDLSFLSVSGNWQSTYGTVSSLSANWNRAYTWVGSNSSIATFTTSVSAPSLSGTHYGDGSKLTGIITGNLNSYLPLSGGSLTGVLSTNSAIVSPTVSANNIFGNSTQTVFTDGVNSSGNGSNTLTMNYLSGVYISQPAVNIASRLYMYAPNGARYYLNVTNSGMLTVTIG